MESNKSGKNPSRDYDSSSDNESDCASDQDKKNTCLKLSR